MLVVAKALLFRMRGLKTVGLKLYSLLTTRTSSR